MKLTTEIKILSALHMREFRHLSHLAANIDMSQTSVHKAIKRLEAERLIETHLESPAPHDGDKTYRFTKIKLTRLGSELALKCYEVEQIVKNLA